MTRVRPCPMRMARDRYRFGGRNLPVFHALGFVFGSLLVVLLLLSVFRRHLLEAQRFSQTWDHHLHVPEKRNGSGIHVPEQNNGSDIHVPEQNHGSDIHVPKPNNGSANKLPVLKQPWELTSVENVPARGDSRITEVWNSSLAEWYHECTKRSERFPSESKLGKNGYLVVDATGDLVLKKAGIADSVAIAWILDATMVVPSLVFERDGDESSKKFEDIFDIDHFISTLADDVRIIKQLPTDQNLPADVRTHVAPRKSTPIYYEYMLYPELLSKRLVKIAATDHRLQDNLDPDLQKLRCRANYKALRFVSSIRELGQKLVERMRQYSKTGRYMAVHLKFDQEMLSSSGCYFGGGENERKNLRIYRRRHGTRYAVKDPHKERREGRCPLTPMELGLLLRAMGFGKSSFLFLVVGQVYGGEETLAPLKKLFPNFYTLNSLATADELGPFQSHPSKLAALDYTICKESNVFAANDRGDMAKIMGGHRRFDGHQRTIRPNFQKLSLLYVARHNLGWNQFASKARIFQEGYTGEPKEQSTGEFYEFPEACICAKGEFQLIKTSQEGRALINRIHKLETNGSSHAPQREWIEIVEEDEEDKDDIISEEAYHSIDPELDEDETVPTEWPWIMNSIL